MEKEKGKGISIDPKKISETQKRLKATGLSISNGKITYKIPKEVKEKKDKEFEKKKKAKKLAKKNKKRK